MPHNPSFGLPSDDPHTLDSTYIMMEPVTPVWQLTDGWFGLEEGFRWPRHMPPLVGTARRGPQIEVVLNIGPQLLTALRRTDFRAQLNGVPLAARLTKSGEHTRVGLLLPPGPPGIVEAEFQADPPFHAGSDPRDARRRGRIFRIPAIGR